jgi:hypothetical protein
MKKRIVTLMAACATGCASVGALALWSNQDDDKKFTDAFAEDKADLVPTGRNPYFILEAGYTLHLRSPDGEEELVIAVLDETKTVDGVETRVVEEREGPVGRPKEISRNYFAISRRTNNVYYFGEETRNYDASGNFTIGRDSWESGVDGARFGLMMPGLPLLGSRYYQEIAPGVAMDRAENVSLTETVETPAGRFTNCLVTEETTPLEPDERENKLYAAGVGLLKDEDFILYKFGASEPTAR